MDELTQMVIDYQKTGTGLQETMEFIAIHSYHLLRKRPKTDPDDISDFFCKFYPRIPAMIKRFQYNGISFYHYLYSTLKWHFRTFIVSRQKQERLKFYFERETFWNDPYWEDNIEVCEPDYSITPAASEVLDVGPSGKISNPAYSKRLLLLTLKESHHVDTHLARCVSIITGLSLEWIFNRIQSLKELIFIRRSRLEELQERRNRYYVNIYSLHVELIGEINEDKREWIAERLGELKTRIDFTRREITKISRAPTHREISTILGIPKGSVDSGLYYIKNSFSEAYNIDISLAG